jgi:isopropylmalate/homocitrate/citramalate synthase
MDFAEEKLRLMKAKAEQFEIKLNDTQMVDVFERFEKLADSEANRELAEKRVMIQAMKQEL